jgi:ATP-dependent 26S proteasome regulatory subunit
MPRPPAPLRQLRDLELLINAHHPIIFLETIEEERAEVLLEHAAEHLGLLYLEWRPERGLQHAMVTDPLEGTVEPIGCLDHIARAKTESLYHLKDFAPFLQHAPVRARLKEAHRVLWRHRGAIVLTGPSAAELPEDVARLATSVVLEPPSEVEYHRFLSDMLRDLRARRTVKMELTPRDVAQLIQQLRGLTFFEVKKVMTQAIAESWSLDRQAIARALEAKKEVLRRTGVLEYSPADQGLDDIAGLMELKRWLKKRRAVFEDPARAREFGLSAPRGILLLGVPGCGKSMSAKAVAREYNLPLIRLDPSRLYTKYIGETEQNLRRATRTAEAMAPIVLWIDEIEKGLSPGASGGDSGVSQRIFGTFLSWLQDKADGVFVIATANDVAELPPELLRKGRFDEIFFVDLPSPPVRREIIALHLARRGRDAARFDLEALVAASEGFSGSELEQAIVSALYAAYDEGSELETRHVAQELGATRPLSATSAEKIARIRAWAQGRAVPAD